MYTGALENRPDLIEVPSRRRQLWGNDAATVRMVRDPIRLAEVLRSNGLSAPGVRLDPIGLPVDGSWLRKPLASSAGHGIAEYRGADESSTACYYQERIEGPSLSAIFVGGRDEASLAGVTRQLIGRGESRFAYRGNVAPWPISTHAEQRVMAIGRTLVNVFGLVGLFGVDFILSGDEPWVVEVNPRYTAAVEVLELALGRALLAEHRSACLGEPIEHRIVGPPDRQSFVAKEIVFAATDLEFDGTEFEPAKALFEIPVIADVPDRGTRFEAGDPVLTVFAEGSTPESCMAALDDRRREWERRLS